MAYWTIPGLGSRMSARISEATRQVVLVSSPDQAATTNTVTMWERDRAEGSWKRVGAILLGCNGVKGWSSDHREGDLRSPIGVFTLTATGGRQPDPGTSMPYEFRPSFYQAGGPDSGPDLAGAFDYVVAIDYNRIPGYPPSNPTRPLGFAAGGNIWLHVDHSSPTRGCITVGRDGIKEMLAWLSPAGRPLIVMGDAASLAADEPADA